MPQRAETKIFKHSFSLLFFLAAFIVMLMSYYNNSWILIRKEKTDGIFMRGLNTDCYNSTVTDIQCYNWDSFPRDSDVFPKPFHKPEAPGFLNYLALWTARSLFFVVASWLGITFTCCCRWNTCKMAFEKNKLMLQVAVLGGGALFMFLFFVMLLCRWTGPSVPNLPEEYYESLGAGFWRFYLGGILCYFGGAAFFFWDKNSASHDVEQGVPMNRV